MVIELIQECRASGPMDKEKSLQLAEKVIPLVGPPLKGFAFRICRNQKQVVEDLHQDILVKIATSLHCFNGNSDGEFFGWAYRIAQNTISQHFRRHRLEDHVDPDEIWSIVEESAKKEPIMPGENLDLEYAVNLLKKTEPPCRNYLWSFYILRMDYSGIAETYELKSYDAARMAVNRCMDKLLDSLPENI